MPWTLNMCHSNKFDAFFPVNINKMWKFCLKLWFFRKRLLQRCETCSIGFGMPWSLNMCHSSHFDAFFPVKINKIWHFWLFAELPLTKKLKRMSIYPGKKCLQRLPNLCILVFGYADHNALCENFLCYYGFSAFLWEGQDIGFCNMV